MSEFRQIESGVPIPKTRKDIAFPELLDLKIGDSFLVSPEDTRRARNCVWQQHRQRKARRYTTRRMNNGLRIWRKA